MSLLILEQLEWSKLLKHLENFCITEKAKLFAQTLTPQFNKDEILKNWNQVLQLKSLFERGFKPPIEPLSLMEDIFKLIKVSPIISGDQCRIIYNLLSNIKKLHKFCYEHEEKYPLLKLFRIRTYVDNNILSIIEKTITPDGLLKDDASEELKRIRIAQISLRKKIEQIIVQMFVKDEELKKYLQDDFFTIRSERYVIPLRLDGRGRIKGSIYDLSASGETIFIEPAAIAPLNEELLDLDLEEKLEVSRIFKEITQIFLNNISVLETNYEELTKLDFLCAQAQFSIKFKTNTVQIVDKPTIKVFNARHPLVRTPEGTEAIGNDIILNDNQRSLVVSGPNAGGKTVVLKTLGILHLMLKSALLVPAEESSMMFLFDQIFLEIGDNQNISESLSSFSAHLLRLKTIIENATNKDLVLLDELGVGTDPQSGAALAQAILEYLVNKDIFVVVSTHFDTLKTLAVENPLFRNGSMEYLTSSYKPTYKLILDVPGISFGFEVAQKVGIPEYIIERARHIKGNISEKIDSLIQSFLKQKQLLEQKENELQQKHLELAEQIDRWKTQTEELDVLRENLKKEFKQKLQDKLEEFQTEHQQIIQELKTEIKKLQNQDYISGTQKMHLYEKGAKTQKLIDKMKTFISEYSSQTSSYTNEHIKFEDIQLNDEVEIISLNKKGIITKIGKTKDESIEVLVGSVKFNVKITDLKKIYTKKIDVKDHLKTDKHLYPQELSASTSKNSEIPLVVKTPTNHIDLRGHSADDALSELWKFIDRAILRGETYLLVIHGHGTETLKKAIRETLLAQTHYKLSFREGLPQEGGDGVTVIKIL